MLCLPPHTPPFPYTTLFRSLNGNSLEAAAIPVNSDEPNTSAMKKDSAKKYPPTITTLPIIQPSTLPITLPSEVRLVNPLCEIRSEEHTSELQSHSDLVCRLP